MSGLACYARVSIVAVGLVALSANGLASPEQQASHPPAQAATPAPRPTPAAVPPASRPTPVAVPPAPNAGAKSTPKPAAGDADVSAEDAVRRIETLMAAESAKTGSQKRATKPNPEAAPPAPGTSAKGTSAKGTPKPARGAETSAQDVVRRIDTLMAAESGKNGSATPARRTAPAPRKPKPTPLLRWGASLAPGNVTLVWGSDLVLGGAASGHAGVRLVWPGREPSLPRK